MFSGQAQQGNCLRALIRKQEGTMIDLAVFVLREVYGYEGLP